MGNQPNHAREQVRILTEEGVNLTRVVIGPQVLVRFRPGCVRHSRRGKIAPCSPVDPSSRALAGHCPDRNRSFDLSPSLAGLVRTRASPDDPAVAALIDGIAQGAGWADIGGGFNLNVRIDLEPPVVLRVHRPWVRRGRVTGLRRLRERLGRTQVRVAQPIRISGGDLVSVGGRWAEIKEFIDHVLSPAGEDSYVRLFEELGRLHAAFKAVWEPSPPEPLDARNYRPGAPTRPAGRGSPAARQGPGRSLPKPRRPTRSCHGAVRQAPAEPGTSVINFSTYLAQPAPAQGR